MQYKQISPTRVYGYLTGAGAVLALTLRLVRNSLSGGPWWWFFDAVLSVFFTLAVACTAVMAVAWVGGLSRVLRGPYRSRLWLLMGFGLLLISVALMISPLPVSPGRRDPQTVALSTVAELLLAVSLYGGGFIVAVGVVSLLSPATDASRDPQRADTQIEEG